MRVGIRRIGGLLEVRRMIAAGCLVLVLVSCSEGSDRLTIPKSVDTTAEIDDWYLEHSEEIDSNERLRAIYERRFQEIQDKECADAGGEPVGDTCNF
jgi:hypothetical protein